MLTSEQLDAATRHLCTLEGKEPTEAQLAHARAVICCHACTHEAIKQAVLYGAEPIRPASAPYIAGPEDAHRSHSRKHLAHRMQLQRIWEALNVNSTDEALQEIQRMQELAGASATTYHSVHPEAMQSLLGTRTGHVPSTATQAQELPQGPSGATLADFRRDQWWVSLLQNIAREPHLLQQNEYHADFKRSVAVVLNLLATVKAHLEGTAENEQAVQQLTHSLQQAQQRECRLRQQVLQLQHQPGAPGVFQIGARVRKTKGSAWSGTIVGYYSTTLNPCGWAVESDAHPGSVQIYPQQALELVEGTK